MFHSLLVAVVAAVTVVVLLAGAGWVALVIGNSGPLSPDARSTGNDAEWLGHAWIDGRKTQKDVDALAVRLRGTGVRDLFVHAGPFADDGTLDPALRPRGRWLVEALHAAVPRVRVQAWLGDVVGPGRMDLGSVTTRDTILAGAAAVLADGFDGVHYDFEPVRAGDTGLLAVLDATRALTRREGAQLSIAATYVQPVRGLHTVVGLLPGRPNLWTAGYLHEVAVRVDAVALMAYDTSLRDQQSYAGFVRRQTSLALDAVPDDVTLLIGVPAYHEETFAHRPSAETVAASLRGVRLALGGAPDRPFGVALYADFAATEADRISYRTDWIR